MRIPLLALIYEKKEKKIQHPRQSAPRRRAPRTGGGRAKGIINGVRENAAKACVWALLMQSDRKPAFPSSEHCKEADKSRSPICSL